MCESVFVTVSVCAKDRETSREIEFLCERVCVCVLERERDTGRVIEFVCVCV